jgi:hypothetical protein
MFKQLLCEYGIRELRPRPERRSQQLTCPLLRIACIHHALWVCKSLHAHVRARPYATASVVSSGLMDTGRVGVAHGRDARLRA